MATVAELSGPYANFMLNPLPPETPDVCSVCLTFTEGTAVAARTFDPGKYNASRDLAGEAILLIDDTWTSGANAQSAAGALKTAGAGAVGVLVIGRHVQETFRGNAARLKALPRRFDWDVCALHPRADAPALSAGTAVVRDT